MSKFAYSQGQTRVRAKAESIDSLITTTTIEGIKESTVNAKQALYLFGNLTD